MKAAFAFLFFVIISFKGFSQIETPKKRIHIAPAPDAKGTVAPSSAKLITYPSIFDKKDKLLSGVSLLKKKEEEPKSVFEQKAFTSQAQEQTDKMNKQIQSEGLTSVVENSDFFYGEYKIFTSKIIIACRDNGQIDGDQVAIWINNERVEPVISLQEGFKKYTFQLKVGVNDIFIEALNTGMLYPNTGQFAFFDGNEKSITVQNWNLNTGYKGIIKVRRIDGIEPK